MKSGFTFSHNKTASPFLACSRVYPAAFPPVTWLLDRLTSANNQGAYSTFYRMDPPNLPSVVVLPCMPR